MVSILNSTACCIFLHSRTGPEAQVLLLDADNIVRSIATNFREIEREKNQFDHNTKIALDRKIRGFTKELNELKKSLAEYKQQLSASSVDAAQRADWRMQRQTILEGRVIGEDTSSSLMRTQRTILEAQTTGTDTVIMLESQTEQMENMLGELSAMQNISAKTKTVLRRMRTKVVTSKLMTFFIVLFEVAILALIIYLKYYS